MIFRSRDYCSIIFAAHFVPPARLFVFDIFWVPPEFENHSGPKKKYARKWIYVARHQSSSLKCVIHNPHRLNSTIARRFSGPWRRGGLRSKMNTRTWMFLLYQDPPPSVHGLRGRLDGDGGRVNGIASPGGKEHGDIGQRNLSGKLTMFS